MQFISQTKINKRDQKMCVCVYTCVCIYIYRFPQGAMSLFLCPQKYKPFPVILLFLCFILCQKKACFGFFFNKSKRDPLKPYIRCKLVIARETLQKPRLKVISLIGVDCRNVISVIVMLIMKRRKLSLRNDDEVPKLQQASIWICSVNECSHAQMPEKAIQYLFRFVLC